MALAIVVACSDSGPVAPPGTPVPASLAIITQPSATAVGGVAFARQPVLQLRDSSDADDPISGVVITATIASGNGTLGGSTTATTDANGRATFIDLSLTGSDGPRTLSFSVIVNGAPLGTVVSTSIALTTPPPPATQLTVTTQPSTSASSGGAFAQQPVVQLRDASNIAVSQAGVIVTAAIATGGGTLGGTATATTDASGVATFTNLSITGADGARTLSFSATGLTGATSGAISVTTTPPPSATQLSITTQPSTTAQSGTAFAQQPALQLRDASNGAVSQAGVVVTAAIATGGGTLSGTAVATTNANGVATFTNLAITGVAGARTLTFSATGLTSATSSSINVTAASATQLSITTQPSASAQSATAFAQEPVIQLRDASNNAVSQAGVVVTAAIATGGGTLGGTVAASTNASGVATFTNLSITGVAGARTLTFSATGLTSVTSASISITASSATQLAITTQPSPSAQSSTAFAQQPVIQLRDASNNAVSQSGVIVTATIATGGGTLGGTVTAATDASGVATFTNLAIAGVAGARTLTFSVAGLTSVTSSSINITASSAAQLTITTQPSTSGSAGAAFAQQPVIQLRDASNNAVSQSGVLVTVAIATGGGTLGGTVTAATDANGVATFTNLSITGTIGARTLTFSATGLTSVTSTAISITAGAALQLAITTQPSTTATGGVAFAQQPVIQLRDASSNAVSQSGVVVSAAIATGGGTLGGTITATTNASGVATFGSLSITGADGARTLSFSATGLTGATSGSITVTTPVPNATQLSITTQPSASAQNGAAFAQQPVIQLRDASSNAVSQSGVLVTATIATGGGTLGGTATATTNASGVASFTNLSITGVVGGRTLTFSATGLASVTSSSVNITASSPTQLTITTQPSATATGGVAFAQQPVLQLRDVSSNAVSQAGIVVTAAIATGGGTLGGTTTATTDGNGVATFTNLSITGVAGARTLSFSAPTMTGVTSTSITVTPPPATQLAITTQPSTSAQNGTAFSQQPVIQLRDASNNAVSQSAVVVTATIGTGGGTLGGTATATTNASGVATFTNLSITGTVGTRTLTFSATNLTSATSASITLTAGQATKLSITTQPSASAQNASAFAQQPVIQLRDASNNAANQSGVVVTAAIATGGGTLGGTATATTDVNGVATFAGLSITGTTGSRTLSFSGTSVTSVTSTAISITAGAATQLAITTQPSANALGGVSFARQPVLQLRDVSGNNVSQSGVSVAAAIATGGGTLGGTTPVTTSSTGVATFTNLSISGADGSRTLSFTASGLTVATSSAISVTTPPPEPTPSGTMILDTRAGGAQDIQAVSSLAGAQAYWAASGGVLNDMEFTTDYNGSGKHAFRLPWGANPGAESSYNDNAFYFASQPVLNCSVVIHLGRTATGGGLGAIGSFVPVTDGGGMKRILWLRQPDDATDRIYWSWPAAGQATQENAFFIDSRNFSDYFENADFGVGVDVRWTFQLIPGNPGTLRVWRDGVLVESNTSASIGALGFAQFQFIATRFNATQDETEYWTDLVVWKP